MVTEIMKENKCVKRTFGKVRTADIWVVTVAGDVMHSQTEVLCS
jgi:hypothetical protein